MRTKIENLTYEQVKTLLENNTDLDKKVFERATDDAWYWLGEYLEDCEEDYSIQQCGYSYFTITPYGNFEEWFDIVQKTFCLFSIDEEAKINEYLDAERRLDYFMDKNYEFGTHEEQVEQAEAVVERLKDEVEELVVKRLTAEYDCIFDLNTRADYFMTNIDFFIEDTENVFVDDNYKVKEFIPKTIIPQRVIQAHNETLF